MTDAEPGAFNTRLAKALSHPLRAQILMILNERVASPKDIADIVDDVTIQKVSYHVRTLSDMGWIELVRTVRRRGFVEHYYRALERPFFSDRDWGLIPKQARGQMSAVTLGLVWEEVRQALDSGTFEERSDRYLIRAPFELDEAGWREVNALAGRFFEEAERVATESRERANDGHQIRSRLVLMHFPMPPTDDG